MKANCFLLLWAFGFVAREYARGFVVVTKWPICTSECDDNGKTTKKISRSSIDTALLMAVPNNKNKKSKKQPPAPTTAPKEKMTDPLQLFFVYMTPWKNPNSIFVYLFIALYALGKYSGAHSQSIP